MKTAKKEKTVKTVFSLFFAFLSNTIGFFKRLFKALFVLVYLVPSADKVSKYIFFIAAASSA